MSESLSDDYVFSFEKPKTKSKIEKWMLIPSMLFTKQPNLFDLPSFTDESNIQIVYQKEKTVSEKYIGKPFWSMYIHLAFNNPILNSEGVPDSFENFNLLIKRFNFYCDFINRLNCTEMEMYSMYADSQSTLLVVLFTGINEWIWVSNVVKLLLTTPKTHKYKLLKHYVPCKLPLYVGLPVLGIRWIYPKFTSAQRYSYFASQTDFDNFFFDIQ